MSKDTQNEEEILETQEEVLEETPTDTQVEEVEIDDSEKFASLDEEFKAKMEAKVAEAEDKAKEAEDKFLRTHADFDNIKKRLEKEKYQAIDYASEKFAKDLLSTMDTLEMALQSATSEGSSDELIEKLKEGIELTIKSMLTTFEKHDISVVDTDEFDPQVHNAVMQVESENHESGQIVQVMQKGYMYKERLLRPAMVSIAN
ncbi:MAG: nucleotide exchange factor GrpE [Arcobacteraceae bacterium]|nr:nucleotide exchange factor GrpE [Arcobacteraceae bacterium]